MKLELTAIGTMLVPTQEGFYWVSEREIEHHVYNVQFKLQDLGFAGGVRAVAFKEFSTDKPVTMMWDVGR